MQENIHFDRWSIFSFHIQNKIVKLNVLWIFYVVLNRKNEDMDNKNKEIIKTKMYSLKKHK